MNESSADENFIHDGRFQKIYVARIAEQNYICGRSRLRLWKLLNVVKVQAYYPIFTDIENKRELNDMKNLD